MISALIKLFKHLRLSANTTSAYIFDCCRGAKRSQISGDGLKLKSIK